MTYVLIGIIIFLIIWFIFAYRLSHKTRLFLVSYIIYLLMDDSIKEDHQSKFKEWIRSHDYPDSLIFGRAANRTIERMAESLGQHYSLLAANKMIWDYKEDMRKG